MRPTASAGLLTQTILIVDDTPANVGVLGDCLEDLGFRVVVAQDGAEAIKRAQFARPDLILLDVMMPGMDGFETCRRLKVIDGIKDIPVMFMTALTDTSEKVTGFSVGGVDYVTKPFQIDEVLARVNTHLALRMMQQRLTTQNEQLQQEIEIRLQAEADLRLTQFSVDHATDAIFWLAADGAITYVNEAACGLLKYSREDLLELHIADIELDARQEDWPQHWTQIKARGAYTVETRMRAKGGMLIPLEASMNYLEFGGEERAFIYARDISERKRAEQSLLNSYIELKESNRKLEELHQQLLQSEKLASIGQLAAGVAHEINNPIAFINSNIGTLQGYIDGLLELIAAYERTENALTDRPALLDDVRSVRKKLEIDYMRDDLRDLLAESLDGVTRVRRIVEDLKNFSRVGETDRQAVDLHSGIDSALNIVGNEIRQKADVKKEYGTIPAIEGVSAQLNQVFMSLLVNALQAIEQHGTITIRTGHEAGWVWVEIADNGCGIKPEHLSRIFEPFFTTRQVGQGAGLGLSLSYGIIAQHGGRIEVNSEPGQGTTCKVWLPVTLP